MRPPPLPKKIQKISVFSAKTHFFLLKPFWIGWDPPLSAKKSKKISVFSAKEILDSARPPPPPFGETPKKTWFLFLMPPLICSSYTQYKTYINDTNNTGCFLDMHLWKKEGGIWGGRQEALMYELVTRRAVFCVGLILIITPWQSAPMTSSGTQPYLHIIMHLLPTIEIGNRNNHLPTDKFEGKSISSWVL